MAEGCGRALSTLAILYPDHLLGVTKLSDTRRGNLIHTIANRKDVREWLLEASINLELMQKKVQFVKLEILRPAHMSSQALLVSTTDGGGQDNSPPARAPLPAPLFLLLYP